MRARVICFLSAALLFIPCVCLAQTQSAKVTAADIEPFVGKWTGQHEECQSASSCESRSVDMTITNDNGTYTLSVATGSFARHSKGSSGSSTKSYPAKFEKVNGITTMSFTTNSGIKIKFSLVRDKLVGMGSSGKFNVKYTLTKVGI